jgi:hypothetical protein
MQLAKEPERLRSIQGVSSDAPLLSGAQPKPAAFPLKSSLQAVQEVFREHPGILELADEDARGNAQL